MTEQDRLQSPVVDPEQQPVPELQTVPEQQPVSRHPTVPKQPSAPEHPEDDGQNAAIDMQDVWYVYNQYHRHV